MNGEAVIVDALRGVATVILIPLAITFFFVAYRLTKAYLRDRSEYVKNKSRCVSPMAVIRGEAPTFFDGIRDERVVAGVAVDMKSNQWVEQGRLSQEALSGVLNRQ